MLIEPEKNRHRSGKSLGKFEGQKSQGDRRKEMMEYTEGLFVCCDPMIEKVKGKLVHLITVFSVFAGFFFFMTSCEFRVNLYQTQVFIIRIEWSVHHRLLKFSQIFSIFHVSKVGFPFILRKNVQSLLQFYSFSSIVLRKFSTFKWKSTWTRIIV